MSVPGLVRIARKVDDGQHLLEWLTDLHQSTIQEMRSTVGTGYEPSFYGAFPVRPGPLPNMSYIYDPSLNDLVVSIRAVAEHFSGPNRGKLLPLKFAAMRESADKGGLIKQDRLFR